MRITALQQNIEGGGKLCLRTSLLPDIKTWSPPWTSLTKFQLLPKWWSKIWSNSTCWRDWWTRALIRFQRDLAIELTMFAKHTALSKLLMKWKSLPKGKACSCASLAHKCKCRYVTGSKCNKTDEKRTAHKILWHSPDLPFPTILNPTKAPKRPPITNTPFGNWKLMVIIISRNWKTWCLRAAGEWAHSPIIGNFQKGTGGPSFAAQGLVPNVVSHIHMVGYNSF